MNIQQIKQRFGIIGNSPGLNRAIEIAIQVAPTDLSVLITGESGTGKENFPQIIHHLSSRKHGSYIAVNCGAIPEGTIDSELFGHEKGSFTGATESRKGYFEEADKGSIFLDEIAELPLSTQVRLLRVLETGEFIRVGSSKVQKTDVRVIAATNVNIPDAIRTNKFREDLYYRLNTVPVTMPALRDRKNDILLLFRKFSYDFSEKYRMPSIKLDDESTELLTNYNWPGNVRQLKNITEQISIIEEQRNITASILKQYLPHDGISRLPAVYNSVNQQDFATERDLLYKILFDMRNEINELKSVVREVIRSGKPNLQNNDFSSESGSLFEQENDVSRTDFIDDKNKIHSNQKFSGKNVKDIEDTEEIVEETFSLSEKEKEMILKALEKYKGKRKYAAKELGISERTLYRKINEYNIE